MVSDFVKVEGGRLYYEATGSGSTVVLIHAGFLDGRMWDGQFQLLARDYNVVRYDVRGYGKSDRPEQKYSDSADLLALLQHLDINKATLIGVSNGGRIALDFAVQQPHMVDKLVLVGTGVSGYETSGPEEDRIWDEFEKQMKPQEDLARENRIREAVEMDVNAWAAAQTTESRERVFNIALDNSHILKDHPGKQQVSPDPPAFKRLSEIRVPTLFIVGDRDVQGMQIIVDKLSSMVKGSRKVVIHGGDHITNMSKPQEFNRTVLEFLGAKSEPSIP